MPRILSQPWTRQPQQQVGVNSRLGITAAWVGSQPSVILGRNALTTYVGAGYSNSVGPGGQALKVGTIAFQAGGVDLGDPDDLLGSTEATIAIFRRCLTTSGVDKYQFGYDNGGADRALAAAPWTDGNIYWDFGSSSTGRLALAYTRDTNPETIVFVAGSAIGREVWRRGVRIGSAPSATATRAATSATQFVLGHSLATGAADDTEVYLCVVANRAWSAAEIVAWSHRPYSETFSPQQIYIPTSVAAPAFSPTLSNPVMTGITTTGGYPAVDYAY